MEWQLHGVFVPCADEEHRNTEGLESVLAGLARLEVSSDMLQQIQNALAPHWSAAGDRAALRVFVSFELRKQLCGTLNDWHFFLVLPGVVTSADGADQKLDLYLY